MDKKQQFLGELSALMNKYKCTRIHADDYYPGYPECGQDVQIEFEFEFGCGIEDFKVGDALYPPTTEE